MTGGGQIGPGGAVVWLKRLDGAMPRTASRPNQIITQREKTFLPHVLAVPLGTTVEFRNDDRIYHNVFSIAKPNDFDAGIRKTGATYTRTFTHPGAVELLCNIHSTMNAYVYVVDSPFFAKAQASGAFSIRGVLPGRYELAAWHEAASSDHAQDASSSAPEGARDVTVSPSAATSARARSSPTNTATNASRSSGTDMAKPSDMSYRRRCTRPRVEF